MKNIRLRTFKEPAIKIRND